MEPEKREISYVLFNTDEMSRGITISDSEAKSYYDDNITKYYHDQEVHARHILFRVKPDTPQAEVDKIKGDAQKVLDEAKKGKDFAELAKKDSQDEATANKGGDLGFFGTKQMEPAFSQAAFGLKPGEISDLVRTPYGFHIIKVEEIHPARTVPFEEVKDDIQKNLKLQKAQDQAYKRVRDLRDLAYARKDIDKAAQEMKLAVTGPIWIEMAADQPDSGPFPLQLKTKLFELGQGDVSDILEIPNGMAVAQLKAIKRSQPIPFETAKEKVTRDYRADQAKILAQKRASEILTIAKDKKSLADVAGEQKLTLRQSEFFSRQDPDKDLKLLRGESLSAVFDLQMSKPFPEAPAELGNRFLVYQLQAKNPAAAPTKVESTTISNKLLREKQATLWDAWLNDVRRNTKVERYQEV
jgi:peptidyl-prolyl cis-trans isomerase D